MTWVRPRYAAAAGAVLALALAALFTFKPWDATAQSLNCEDVPNSIQLPIASCDFSNAAVHPVNDIHIVFEGLVFKLSSDPSSTCRRRVVFLRSGGLRTVYDCRFGLVRGSSEVPPFEEFTMVVFYLQPGGPNIQSWYWTVNGTPVTITPTATDTPEPIDTPGPDDPTSTATDTPEPVDTPGPD